MGRIFKTPSDDTTEETLRMMHTANMVDITYERTMGWIKVIFFSTITAFTVSGYEYYTDWNLWEDTGNWIKEKLTSWSESIFD
tara:strand:- start:37 stop:285 length:249 start_codon:yes stop_codon:yes gene_type:complete